MLNYSEALSYIKNLSSKGSDFTLTAISDFLTTLNKPQDKLNIIHIAGTNGKGSTITYLSNILIESGYTVGTFMTPAVFNYNEIYQINNEPISNEQFEKYFNVVFNSLSNFKDRDKITSFELETAIAYYYFCDKKVDFAIIECGMGGLLDATNLEKRNILSVITQIDYDHTSVLGNSLREIATQKCGIIRSSAVVTTISNEKVLDTIKLNAEKQNAKLIVTSDSTSYFDDMQNITYKNICYKTKMLGEYQKINLPLAIESALYLKQYYKNITTCSINSGIEKAFIGGRLQLIKTSPPFIIDGAHNPNGASYMAKFLQKQQKDIYLLLGIFKDKDTKSIVSSTVKYAKQIFLFDWDNPRHLDSNKMQQLVNKYNKNTVVLPLEKAVEQAIKQATDNNGMVVAFGSLSFLADIKTEAEKW